MSGNSNHITGTIAITGLALVAFAANSVLCRLALGEGAIDAASFTVIRLLSGAIVLFTIISLNKESKASTKGSWSASLMLFLYAVTFSFAYISLDTGTGALILFGTVQITMILLSVFSGHRIHVIEWTGVSISFLGFLYLLIPGVTTPSLYGFILMTMAGIAWGIYTIKGRSSSYPLTDTAYNFIRSMPLVIALAIVTIAMNMTHYSINGILLAMLSGAIASGIGYAIWYRALAGLTTTQAAVVQLLVPVIAAFGGVIFVSEILTLRLVVSAIMVLGGILIVVLGRYYSQQAQSTSR